MNRTLVAKKFIVLVLGLFILAFGIALSSKSGLGVSPSASLAFVLSQIFPFSMGLFTTFINVVFVLIQIALLRKNYKPVNLLQLLVVFIFSYFTDLTLAIVSPIEIHFYPIRLLMCILSCLIMALGVFLEVKASLIVMASEGAISAISDIFKLDFGTVKIILDWGFIFLSTGTSLLVFHSLLGVREGTIIAAFLVGFFVRIYNRHIHFLDKFLGMEEEAETAAITDGRHPLVITIEREFGSGGHEIGKQVAQKLGIAFYDYELIAKTAAKTGLPADSIKVKEERLSGGILSTLYLNSNATTQFGAKTDAIFEAQKKVIHSLAASESCVIVGRLGSYILRNRPNTLHLFFSADDDFKAARVSKQYNISSEEALKVVRQETMLRVSYCTHFTGQPWGLAAHYGMTLRTSDYGIDATEALVLDAVEKFRENR